MKTLGKRLTTAIAVILPAAALVLSPVIATSAHAKTQQKHHSSVQKTSAHKSHKTKPATAAS